MKKSDLLNYGIPEEKIPVFQAHWWDDVRKEAKKELARQVVDGRERETVPIPGDLRKAICSMLYLIPDVNRLSVILSNVNRQYQLYKDEQGNHAGDGDKAPENAQKGASECL